jgi:hypothetical protein
MPFDFGGEERVEQSFSVLGIDRVPESWTLMRIQSSRFSERTQRVRRRDAAQLPRGGRCGSSGKQLNNRVSSKRRSANLIFLIGVRTWITLIGVRTWITFFSFRTKARVVQRHIFESEAQRL